VSTEGTRGSGLGLTPPIEYPAVKAAIARFQKRWKIDAELWKKIKTVAKKLNIEI